jgi:hypothetical protein
MARQPTPTASRWLMADEHRRIGATARGWLGLAQFLTERWSSEMQHASVRLWVGAQAAQQIFVTVRVRAATSLEPWPR